MDTKLKKPELLVTAGSTEEALALIEAGADAILMGEQQYGLRMPGSLKKDLLAESVKMIHQKNAKIYIAVNAILDNASLEELPRFLNVLKEMEVDAIVFGDPAVLVTLREQHLNIPLHWSAEMTSTNFTAANYWGSHGATRVVLARELNMEQIIKFTKQSDLEIQIQVHGATNIYHSKRKLLQSYTEHQQKKNQKFDISQGLYLVEVERKDECYPIFEDEYGTHIMSSDDICMLENLPELINLSIDSFKIEGILKPLVYNIAVVKSYREVIDTYCLSPDTFIFHEQWLQNIRQLQHSNRELSYGFFYKEQVY